MTWSRPTTPTSSTASTACATTRSPGCRSHQDSTILYTFEATSSLPLNRFEITRSATLSATVSVQELDGSPSTGLTKDLIRFRMYDADNGWEGKSGTPYEKLEAIGEGKYQIREPFSPYRESGKLRFEVEVVAPGLPIQATCYRR